MQVTVTCMVMGIFDLQPLAPKFTIYNIILHSPLSLPQSPALLLYINQSEYIVNEDDGKVNVCAC